MRQENHVYTKEIPSTVKSEDFSFEISVAILESLKKRGLLTHTQVERCKTVIGKSYRNDKSRE